jgi:hypothetical protein
VIDVRTHDRSDGLEQASAVLGRDADKLARDAERNPRRDLADEVEFLLGASIRNQLIGHALDDRLHPRHGVGSEGLVDQGA